jgi:hypothetical protein
MPPASLIALLQIDQDCFVVKFLHVNVGSLVGMQAHVSSLRKRLDLQKITLWELPVLDKV